MTEPVGPVDATQVPRYAGLTTFARLPRLEREALTHERTDG
jgi:agmatinase